MVMMAPGAHHGGSVVRALHGLDERTRLTRQISMDPALMHWQEIVRSPSSVRKMRSADIAKHLQPWQFTCLQRVLHQDDNP